MALRLLHWLGLAACIALIVSCFMPWAYFADATIPTEAERTFTGFFSYKNFYGKPGKLLVALAGVVFIFMLIPKVWAKRTNLFLAALAIAYAVTNYIRYGSCYNNYCPDRLWGLYLMLGASVIMMIAVMFPRVEEFKERSS